MNSSEILRNYKHDIVGKFNDIQKVISRLDEASFGPESSEILSAVHDVLVKMVLTSERTIDASLSVDLKQTEETLSASSVQDQVIVLIDDDKLIHLSWNLYFGKKQIAFKSYFSVGDFLKDADSFEKNTPIFIDSDLGSEKGEVRLEKIFHLGFKSLFLSTGYEESSIRKPHWIQKIYSKDPAKIFS